MYIKTFTFNPFTENTYVLWDDTRECVIVDPGCCTHAEEHELEAFVSEKQLTPARLINTHCHIDHVLGVGFVQDKYGLQMEIHRGELPVLRFVPQMGQMYGMFVEPVETAKTFLDEDTPVTFGTTSLEVLLTPGHSPAGVCLYDQAGAHLIAGDVLFRESIGRTDLPGGDYDTLIGSIRDKIFPLGDSVTVYPGHGPQTTIGYERQNNPFLRGIF
jgi:hydroxyacylglutathione hydrolase